MEIIESFLLGKDPKAAVAPFSGGEDHLVITNDFAAVIDGVSPKNNSTYDGMSTGRRILPLLQEALENLNRDVSARNAISHLTKAVRNFYVDRCIEKLVHKNPTERLSASVIIYSRERREIWSVGDSQAMSLPSATRYQFNKKIDDVTSEARALYLRSLLEKGMEKPKALKEARAVILPLLENQAQFENHPDDEEYGYGVINGFFVPDHLINIRRLPKSDNEIILASDGYFKVFPSLKQTEAYLTRCLKEDPEFYKTHRATKGLIRGLRSFDDRAYLRIKVGS